MAWIHDGLPGGMMGGMDPMMGGMGGMMGGMDPMMGGMPGGMMGVWTP